MTELQDILRITVPKKDIGQIIGSADMPADEVNVLYQESPTSYPRDTIDRRIGKQYSPRSLAAGRRMDIEILAVPADGGDYHSIWGRKNLRMWYKQDQKSTIAMSLGKRFQSLVDKYGDNSNYTHYIIELKSEVKELKEL